MGSGGGSSETTTVDPVYNAGLLDLFREEQGWAAEMYNQFKYGVTYDPEATQAGAYIDGEWVPGTELKGRSTDYQIENPEWVKWKNQQNNPFGGRNNAPEPEHYITNTDRLETRKLGDINGYDPTAHTSEMDLLQQMVDSNASLLGLQTDVQKKTLETQGKALDLSSSYLDDLNKGIDVNGRMNEAQANVQHGFKTANKAARMDVASYGLDPSSGRYAGLNKDRALSEAAGIAGARTQAKNAAETEDFQRKTTGLSMFGGGTR